MSSLPSPDSPLTVGVKTIHHQGKAVETWYPLDLANIHRASRDDWDRTEVAVGSPALVQPALRNGPRYPRPLATTWILQGAEQHRLTHAQLACDLAAIGFEVFAPAAQVLPGKRVHLLVFGQDYDQLSELMAQRCIRSLTVVSDCAPVLDPVKLMPMHLISAKRPDNLVHPWCHTLATPKRTSQVVVNHLRKLASTKENK